MKFIKKNLKWITMIVLLIAVIFLIVFKVYLTRQEKPKEELENSILKIEEEDPQKEESAISNELVNKVFIDIKGAVVNPGVYEIEESKKVIDAVNLAGGFTENANTTLINLAKQVKSEMVIIIYTNEEVEKASEENTIIKVIDKECICPEIKNDACLNQEAPKEESSTSGDEENSNNGQVNINTATKEELESLPGIGASKAEAIIQYREEIGGFKTIEEIKEVSGIGESAFEKIKDNITI